jgi:hypothetical protein
MWRKLSSSCGSPRLEVGFCYKVMGIGLALGYIRWKKKVGVRAGGFRAIYSLPTYMSSELVTGGNT